MQSPSLRPPTARHLASVPAAPDVEPLPDLAPEQLELLQAIRDYELELAYAHWNQPAGDH